MLNYFLVAAGGAIGSVARFWLTSIVDQRTGGAFPFGTLLVNVTGSFAIGAIAAFTAHHPQWTSARALLMVGICGGYTTFSAFSLQNLNLLRDGKWLYASLNTLASVVVCMIAVWMGHMIGSTLSPAKSA